MKTPEIGRRYDTYHDGKCSPSRLAVVVIDKIASRKELSSDQLMDWKEAISADFDDSLDGCVIYGYKPNQFWDWNCDCFAIGHFHGIDEKGDAIFFARRPDGSWYSVDWNRKLDVSGSVRRKCLPMWRQAAAECGQTMKWNREAGRFDYFDSKTGAKIKE